MSYAEHCAGTDEESSHDGAQLRLQVVHYCITEVGVIFGGVRTELKQRSYQGQTGLGFGQDVDDHNRYNNNIVRANQ